MLGPTALPIQLALASSWPGCALAAAAPEDDPVRDPVAARSEPPTRGRRGRRPGHRALGLREGAIHAEVRLNDEGAWILEVAARSIGGLCARTLRFGAGVSLEELLLRHAAGLELPPHHRERSASGVLMLPIRQAGRLREVRGQSAARPSPTSTACRSRCRAGRRSFRCPRATGTSASCSPGPRRQVRWRGPSALPGPCLRSSSTRRTA